MKQLSYFFFFLFISQGTKAQTVQTTVPQPIDSNILVVIQGNVAGTLRELKKDVNTMVPADLIESINVLKGPSATDKYGSRGKAGVIEIQLKNVVVSSNGDSIYRKVEKEASFPENESGWRRYLERNLNADLPASKGAPEGTYTVLVEFIVDRDGSISSIKPLTKLGYGMEEEVARVVAEGPKWNPAYQAGRTVKAYRRQPVTFQVISDNWFKLSTSRISAGVPSLIEIKDMDHLKPEDIVVKVSDGTVTHDSGKKYLIKVDKPGKVFLTVSKNVKKKKDEFDYGSVEITVE